MPIERFESIPLGRKHRQRLLDRRALGGLRGKGLDRTHDRGIRAAALREPLPQSRHDMDRLRQKRGRRFCRDQRQELEKQRQIVGQLGRRDLDPVQPVDLAELDHRLPAVARFAVHVLVKMQRQRAIAVEERNIALLGVQRRQCRELRDERCERSPMLRRQQRFPIEYDAKGAGIRQQVRLGIGQ